MDNVDWQIVDELQGDARLSYSELSRRVHLSTPAIAERVRRLERSGLIRGYRADIDPVAAGWAVHAFVRLSCYGRRSLNSTESRVTIARSFGWSPSRCRTSNISSTDCRSTGRPRARSCSHHHCAEVRYAPLKRREKAASNRRSKPRHKPTSACKASLEPSDRLGEDLGLLAERPAHVRSADRWVVAQPLMGNGDDAGARRNVAAEG